jgi:hypothetical protein
VGLQNRKCLWCDRMEAVGLSGGSVCAVVGESVYVVVLVVVLGW